MTDLADYWPPVAPDDRETAPRRHRHEWVMRPTLVEGRDAFGNRDHIETPTVCRRCGAVRDEAKARVGKSSRRLGHDGERRSEKRYGWRKVGEFGGITDLEGTLAIVQQKTTRTAAPKRWTGIFRQLEARAGGRIPLLLLSFVHQGIAADDYIVIRGQDWLALHGEDKPR
jgi:ribosomal protein L37E